MAGMILAALIPLGDGSGQTMDFTQPTLALLGGFAASAVYRILNRLVAAIDSIVRGDTREIVAAREQAAKARVAEQTARSRMETAARLVALQQKLEDGHDRDDLREHLSTLVSDVVGTEIAINGSGRRPAVPGQQGVKQLPPAG